MINPGVIEAMHSKMLLVNFMKKADCHGKFQWSNAFGKQMVLQSEILCRLQSGLYPYPVVSEYFDVADCNKRTSSQYWAKKY